MGTLKLISWNVNGLRAVLKKNFVEFVLEHDPDVLCLQETKARPEQVELPLELGKYKNYWNSAEKAGYSGTAIFTKKAPLEVRYGMDLPEHDREGRVITAEYENYFLVTVYTPNSQNELKRLPYRTSWDESFLAFLQSLEQQKPVIFCGDLNVAHQPIDLARPQSNRNSPGFSDQERANLDSLLQADFIDTFRYFHPEEPHRYSWWSYRANARSNNVGWRLDYFGVSKALTSKLVSADILDQVWGSDHCPVELVISD